MPGSFTNRTSSFASRSIDFRGMFSRSAERQRQDDVIKRAMPGCAYSLRKEFHWHMMGLTENNPQKFATSSWIRSQYPYAAFRVACFIHAISILAYKAYAESTREEPPPIAWIETLPTWSFIVYTTYHAMALVFTVLEFFHDCLCNDDLAWYHMINWVIQSIAFNGSIICFVGSLGSLAATGSGDVTAQDWLAVYTSDDVNFYVITASVMIIDVFVCNVTVRLLHLFYPTVFYVLFYAFHIYRWASGFTPGLVALDYGARPEVAVPHIFLTILVLAPLAHITAYAIDTVRWRLMVTCIERHRRRVIDRANALEGIRFDSAATTQYRHLRSQRTARSDSRQVRTVTSESV